MPSLSLPLLPNAYTISYPPTAPDKAPELIQYFPLPDILSRAWTTDAHTTAYSVQSLSFRLSKAAIILKNGVVMVVFFADIDWAQAHAVSGGHSDIPAPDDWWLEELEKLERLRAAFPGAFIYRTRGGIGSCTCSPSRTSCARRPMSTPGKGIIWRGLPPCVSASPSTLTPPVTIGNGSIECPMRPAPAAARKTVRPSAIPIRSASGPVNRRWKSVNSPRH